MEENNNMKILITGHKGFIGRHLVDQLKSHEIIGFDKGDTLPEHPVDLVIHLAANVNAYASYEEPRQAIENVDLTFEVLEWMRKTGTNKILFASSREVYSMENPYGWSKFAGEALVNTYVACYDIGAMCVRIANVFGKGNLSHRFIESTIEKAQNNRDIVIYGGEEKILNFIHVYDCVEWLEELIDEIEIGKFKTQDVVGKDSMKLVDIAQMIIALTNSKSKIIYEPNRRGETLKYTAKTDREMFSLETRIKELI